MNVVAHNSLIYLTLLNENDWEEIGMTINVTIGLTPIDATMFIAEAEIPKV